LCALAAKHLPGKPLDETTLGTALFLERSYWEKMQTVIANGIGKAVKGQ